MDPRNPLNERPAPDPLLDRHMMPIDDGDGLDAVRGIVNALLIVAAIAAIACALWIAWDNRAAILDIITRMNGAPE